MVVRIDLIWESSGSLRSVKLEELWINWFCSLLKFTDPENPALCLSRFLLFVHRQSVLILELSKKCILLLHDFLIISLQQIFSSLFSSWFQKSKLGMNISLIWHISIIESSWLGISNCILFPHWFCIELYLGAGKNSFYLVYVIELSCLRVSY